LCRASKRQECVAASLGHEMQAQVFVYACFLVEHGLVLQVDIWPSVGFYSGKPYKLIVSNFSLESGCASMWPATSAVALASGGLIRPSLRAVEGEEFKSAWNLVAFE
jgi:hypothetical protein